MCMSAGYDKAGKRRFKILVFDIVRTYMTFNVMYSHKWFVKRKTEGFCLGNAHEKSSHETRSVSDSDGVDIVKSAVSFLQGK